MTKPNEYRSRPQIPSDAEIDVSEAHFLDHTIWQCKEEPGGRKRHLEYRWVFQWKPSLLAATLCKLGRHDPGQSWKRVGSTDEWVTFVSCSHCFRRLSKDQRE